MAVTVPPLQTIRHCRLCGSRKLEKLIAFGKTPLANNYLAKKDLAKKEFMAPLTIARCADCKVVQLMETVAPRMLFENYLYVSSTSPSFRKHFEDYAAHVKQKFSLTSKDLVIDLGSNDGVLLKPFKELGMKVLGIEPAKNIAKETNAKGLTTIAKFLTPKVAKEVSDQYGHAKVITANNVFAHLDVHPFVESIKIMLDPEGVYIFEVQYLKDLVEKNLFDIVYHEHVLFYHLAPLVQFFKTKGMRVFDVERLPVHGGSMRVFVCLEGASQSEAPVVKSLLKEEKYLNTPAPYKKLAKMIAKNKQALQKMIADFKKKKMTVAGYGAPAKATTLMYAYGLTKKHLDFIVDDSPLKQGRWMPGTRVPIVSSKDFYDRSPDVALILAWNFAEQIMKGHEKFLEHGGAWIVPVPKPMVIKNK